MRTVVEDNNVKTIQKVWDWHGSYQWTYFDEEIKQIIDFFLSKRLSGKNLDLGGGWYLPYENSTVIDVSPVCLEYNIAKEKILFDLDSLGNGKKLPFKSQSFDSATMISVWQYLQHPEKVMKELERVLIPGSEVYIINGQGAGLDECVVNESRTEAIKAHIAEMNRNYDCLIERIPSPDYMSDTFRSLCVAMPGQGNKIARVKDRKKRTGEGNDSSLAEYHEFKLNNFISSLSKISEYPVTEYSMKYKEKIDNLSREYFALTGIKTMFYLDHGIKPDIDMFIPDKDIHLYETVRLINAKKNRDMGRKSYDFHDFSRKHGFSCGTTSGSFPKSLEELTDECNELKNKYEQSSHSLYESNNHSMLEQYAQFVASVPLNSYAKEVQEKIYSILKNPEFDNAIKKCTVWNIGFTCHQHKQRRHIDRLIATKEKILKEKIKTVETARFDFMNYSKELYDYIKAR
jgi:SAM-dependent methyltransferase